MIRREMIGKYKYLVRVNDGYNDISFEFDNLVIATGFATSCMEHMATPERTYRDPGVTISIQPVKEEKPEEEENTTAEAEEDNKEEE